MVKRFHHGATENTEINWSNNQSSRAPEAVKKLAAEHEQALHWRRCVLRDAPPSRRRLRRLLRTGGAPQHEARL
jgi:hypothetical protein